VRQHSPIDKLYKSFQTHSQPTTSTTNAGVVYDRAVADGDMCAWPTGIPGISRLSMPTCAKFRLTNISNYATTKTINNHIVHDAALVADGDTCTTNQQPSTRKGLVVVHTAATSERHIDLFLKKQPPTDKDRCVTVHTATITDCDSSI
jgi:hypothetical protein